jgi:hypothetical protein
MASNRKADNTQFQIDRLERKHTELKAQIAEIHRRVFLSQQEQLQVTELKKEKLAAKDAIAGLRRHH